MNEFWHEFWQVFGPVFCGQLVTVICCMIPVGVLCDHRGSQRQRDRDADAAISDTPPTWWKNALIDAEARRSKALIDAEARRSRARNDRP